MVVPAREKGIFVHGCFWHRHPNPSCKLARHTKIPLAAGENHYAWPVFRELFEARAIAIVQADVCKTGGLSEGKKIAGMPAVSHLHAAPHTSHSILSNAASAHLLSALPNGLIYEADMASVNPFHADLATVPFGAENGFIEARDEPGLGIDIDEGVLEAYPAIPGPCYIGICERDNLIEKAKTDGACFLDSLQQASGNHPIFGEVRGLGCWLAIELTADKKAKAPFPDETVKAVVDRMRENGVLGSPIGTAFELAPLLITTRAQFDTTTEVIACSIDEVARARGLT